MVLKVKTNRFFLVLKCLEQLYKVIESEKTKTILDGSVVGIEVWTDLTKISKKLTFSKFSIKVDKMMKRGLLEDISCPKTSDLAESTRISKAQIVAILSDKDARDRQNYRNPSPLGNVPNRLIGPNPGGFGSYLAI